MCEAANQTICAETRELVFKKLGTRHVDNRTMRKLIRQNGGCLAPSDGVGLKLDNPQEVAVV